MCSVSALSRAGVAAGPRGTTLSSLLLLFGVGCHAGSRETRRKETQTTRESCYHRVPLSLLIVVLFRVFNIITINVYYKKKRDVS